MSELDFPGGERRAAEAGKLPADIFCFPLETKSPLLTGTAAAPEPSTLSILALPSSGEGPLKGPLPDEHLEAPLRNEDPPKSHRKSSFAASLWAGGRNEGGPPQQIFAEEGAPWEAFTSGDPQDPTNPWAGPCETLETEQTMALTPRCEALEAAAAAAATAAETAEAAAATAATAATALERRSETPSKPSNSPSRSLQQQQQKQQQKQQQQQQQQQLSESVLQAIAIRKLQLLPLREWEDEQRARRDEFFRAIGEVMDAVASVFSRSEQDHQQILKFLRARAKVDKEAARALRHCSGSRASQYVARSGSSGNSAAAAVAAAATGVATEGPLRREVIDGVPEAPSSSSSRSYTSPASGAQWRQRSNEGDSSSSSRRDTLRSTGETETPPWLSEAYEQVQADGAEETLAASAAVAAAATPATVPHAAASPNFPSDPTHLLTVKGFEAFTSSRYTPESHSNSSSSSSNSSSENSRRCSVSSEIAAAATAAAAAGNSRNAALQQQLFGVSHEEAACASWVEGLMEWTRQQSLLQEALATFAEKEIIQGHLESLVLHYERAATKEIVALRQLQAAAKRADAASREAWVAYVQLVDSCSVPVTFERQHLQKKKPACCWLSEHKYRVATKKAGDAIYQLMRGALRSLKVFYDLETWRRSALSQLFRILVLKVYSHCSAAISTLDSLAGTMGLSLPGLSKSGGESAAAAALRECVSLLQRLQESAAAAPQGLQEQQTSGVTTGPPGQRQQPKQQTTRRKSLGTFSFLSDGDTGLGASPVRCTDTRIGSQETKGRAETLQRGDSEGRASVFSDSKELFPLWSILCEEELLQSSSPGIVPSPFRWRLLSAAAETLHGRDVPPSSRLLLRRGPAQLQVSGLSSLLTRWETGFVCLSKSRLLHFFSSANEETPLRTFFVGNAEIKRIGSRGAGNADIQVTEKKRRGFLPKSSVVFRVSGSRECSEWLSALEMAADDTAFLASAQDMGLGVEVQLDPYDSLSLSFSCNPQPHQSHKRGDISSPNAADPCGLTNMRAYAATAAAAAQQQEETGGASMDDVSLDEHAES